MELAFTCNSLYFPGLVLAVASVLHTSRGLECAGIHILNGGLTPQQRGRLEKMVGRDSRHIRLTFHDIDDGIFLGMRRYFGNTLTYCYLLLPELLSDRDEVLYLDVDLVFGADLQEVWQIDIGSNAVVAVQDSLLRTLGHDCPWLAPGSPDADKPYFNTGVMKLNLDYWRRHDVGATALKIAREEPDTYTYCDQTILNYLLQDAVYWLPERFNTQESREYPLAAECIHLNGRNIHYISARKPWRQHSSRTSFRLWRSRYAALVSVWPDYMLTWRYWLPFLGRECLEGRRMYIPLLRFLLGSGLYRLVPELSRSQVEEILRETCEGHRHPINC